MTTRTETPTGRTAAPDGPTAPPTKYGCIWKQEKNPDAGSAEADWHWVEYRVVESN